MGSLKKYYFAKSKGEPNTFIGGVSSVVTSANVLATFLAISVARVKKFTIVGSDVQCRIIGGSYPLTITNNASNTALRTLITYFQDNDGLVSNISASCFALTTKLARVYLPGVTTATNAFIFQDVNVIGCIVEMPNCISIPNSFFGNYSVTTTKITVLPKCINFGSTELNNTIFSTATARSMRLYAPVSKQTSNAGGVEGDVAAVAAGVGASVVFVPNYTRPSPITTLVAGTISTTTIQLNFSIPSSTNTIDFYEYYLNGVYRGRITASGQSISGLTTSTMYKISLVAVDIYYNKSILSNIVTATTL
jgi:hypothetical protein